MKTKTKTSRNWCTSLIAFMLTWIVAGSAWASSPDLVIDQVCVASSTGSTYNQKFVVLFNRSASPKNIQGYTLQTASSTGTSWTTVWTGGNVTIPGYSYYLIGGSTTSSGGAALPVTPDATSTFNSSASSAKVVLLSSSTGPGAVTDPQSAANFVDFIGYGSANAAEGGSANTMSVGGNLQLMERSNGGCTDSDNNKNDFVLNTSSGNVKYSGTTAHACGNSIAPETAANGSGGSAYAGGSISQNSSITVYAVVRDSANNFFLNDKATWSLVNKTGNIVDGDLVPSSDGRSAVYHGTHTGTATIRVSAGTLTSTDSGTVTVAAAVPTQVRVETAADGSGTVVPSQTLSQGATGLTVYAIARDAGGAFVANTNATWSLVSKTGSVADSDLVPAGDNKSAVFNPNNVGSAAIDAAVSGLTSTDSGTITVAQLPPVISGVSPAGPLTNNAGTTITLTATVSGASTYQWQKGGVNLNNGAAVANTSAAVSGATTPSLTLTSVFAADAGSYHIVVSNAAGPVTSSDVVVSVVDPIISAQPAAAVEVRAGHLPNLSATAVGSAPMSYQWQKNGANYPGATSSAFNVPLSISDSGAYTLIASNAYGSVTSSASTVTVKASTQQLSLNQNMTKGHLVLWRVGDGATSLNNSNFPVSIVEMDTNGATIQAIGLPTSGDTALTVSGNAFGEGWVATTPDSSKLVIGGYNAAQYTVTNVSASAATAGRRSVATLDSAGNFTVHYTSSTATGNIRGVAGDNSGNYWATLSTGMVYMNNSGALTAINSRGAYVMPDGTLWYTTGSGTQGAYMFTNGLPTIASTAALEASDTNGSPWGAFMSPDGNTLYVGDANATGTSTGGARKYTKSGGVWTFQYALVPTITTNIGPFDMAVDFSGPNPVLYCTVNDGGANNINNSVVRIEDTGASATGTIIATAGSLYSYHGIRFAPYGAPVIAVQPTATAVTEGNNASFSITLDSGTSTNNLTYVWKNGQGTTLATHVSTALSDTFTFSNAQLSDNGTPIHCEVSNSQGSALSDSANLGVNPAGAPPVVYFDITPDRDPSFSGQTVSMAVTMTGTTPMTYSWAGPNGAITSGGRYSISTSSDGLTSTLTISGVKTNDSGNYYVGITNAYGGTSSFGSISVSDPAPPTITIINPSGTVTNNAGTTRNVSIGATDDSGVLTYQWKHNGNNLSDGSHANGATVAGANTSILTLAGVLGGDDGTYNCIVSNAGGSTDSASSGHTAVLIVNDPIVTAQPVSHIVVAGSTLTVNVAAAGTGMTFQWSKDGNPLSDGGRVSGATASTLSIASADASDAGVYSVAINSSFGAVSTTPAKIVIAQTTAQPLYATNIVVLQRGDGLEGFSANGNTVFLLQYDTAGNLVSCFAVPNSGVNSLIQAGNTPTEGWLTKSADGQSLVFAGYATPLAGAPGLAASTGATANRAVGTIDKLGNYLLAAKGTNHSTGNIRSAAGDGLGNFWTAGSKDGVEAYLNGNPNGLQIIPSVSNLRVVQPVNGDLLWASSSPFGTSPNRSNGVYRVSGLPTTATTVSLTGWYVAAGPTNVLDLDVNDFAVSPDATVAYLSDGEGFGSPDVGGIHRFDKSAGVWTHTYSITQASRGLTVDWSGPNPVIYATTPLGGATNGDNFVHSGNDVVKVVDTGANSTPTIIATAVGGCFAGIRTAPGTAQTITFPAIADVSSCSGPITPAATASSGLPVSYSIVSGPATIVGGQVVLTTPITNATTVTVRASQSGNGTYSAALSVTKTFTVNPATVTLSVTGTDPLSTCVGGGFSDPGATATNSCGDALTVNTTGSVDPNTIGSYTLTYSATDATSGATATATRVVNVIDCSIAITTQPLDQLHQPQGTNVTLSVAATGNSLSYQWYLNGAAVNGANGTSFSFTAQPDQVTGTNLTAYVVVSNPWTTVQSSVAHVNIIIDKVKPTLTLISPANNNRATSFTVKGKVTDSKGNGALLKYYWTALPLTTPPAQTATYTIDISNVGTTPSSRDFSATGFPLQNPTDAGTNQLTIWTEDLAGNDSSPVKNVKVFYQVPHTYALTISGDGTGSVAVSTKGAAHETVSGAPTGTIVGSANHTYNLTLFARQDYTFKFTADPKADKPTVGVSVGSVVSNALPAQAAGTTTTKPVSITFEAANADASANVSFDRNRFLDMAGTYTGVFSGTPNAPTKDNSRLFVLTVSPTRTVSGYLLDANKAKTTIPPKTSLRDDGSITVAIGGITVSGSLGWTGSENATGIKQFVGTATDGNWTAQLTADKEDKTALPTDGFATMQIPGGFAGNGFATIKSKNGVVTATYTLADDDKHPIVMAVTGSRSGNIPQWVINTHSGSLLFGNLVVGDGLTTISAPSLSWIRPANNGVYPSLMPAGFTLAQFAATCSPFNPAQLLSGNYTLSLTGGSLATDINGQAVTFSSSKMTAAGKVKAGSMDANGKLKFTFLDGSTPTHTTIAQGVILQNAGNGAGFFIRTGAADTGVMTLTPVTP